MNRLTRRRFLGACGVAGSAVIAAQGLTKRQVAAAERAAEQNTAPARETYETHAKGIRIFSGHWRPHYVFEQIAWVSPAWPSQDYVWLDFPEAIFVGKRLLYLSHINPAIECEFSDLPAVPWTPIDGGIAFERALPNGLTFGGSVVKEDDSNVELELHLTNRTDAPLREITLQTCAYLRAIREFAEFTRDNKFMHHGERWWITVSEARWLPAGSALYRDGGWARGALQVALPIIATRSAAGDRWIAMTWFTDTLSLVGNPNHPCMHADPQFPDLVPGESATIRGRLGFFQGALESFDAQSFVTP